jgi:hypothetical protein
VAKNVLKVTKFLRCTPYLVLDIVNKNGEVVPSDALSAARDLTRMGLRVLVDSSEGALPPDYLAIFRGVAMYVDYMTWDTVQKIPELKELLNLLEEFKLTNAVWDVIGGCPLQYDNLKSFIHLHGKTKENVLLFLGQMLIKAMNTRNAYLDKVPSAEETLKLFSQHDVLRPEMVIAKDLACTLTILRNKDGEFVPRTRAMACVLKHNLRSASEVRKFCEDLATKGQG